MNTPLSPTLAANEILEQRRRDGKPVLPLAFGEAGLPVHPSLIQELAKGAGHADYTPVAGIPELRQAAAGYWARRNLPTSPNQVICAPGSKALIYTLLIAIGGDVIIPQPSWVSYAAQAQLAGHDAVKVPTRPGQGGVPDPTLVAKALLAAKRTGRSIKSIIVTLPDNPTGTLAAADTLKELCTIAQKHELVIISDEIYRDLMHDPKTPFVSPAELAPDCTVVTTGLSKNLALGGWRLGIARMPANTFGESLWNRMLGIASEIWSCPTAPVQYAAAYAFSEPPALRQRIEASARLHSRVARALRDRFIAAGAIVPEPQGAFYIYPDLEPWRPHLKSSLHITTAADLADYFLHEYGLGILPGSAFGEPADALRFRVATSMLYGSTKTEREQALRADKPEILPWITTSLDQLSAILNAVRGPVPSEPLVTK